MTIAFEVRTVLVATAILFAGATAEAQINCGATITKDTVMTSDISCGVYDPAFTVVGPAKVDMNGYRVLACKAGGTGIRVNGQGATLRNGAVTGCGTGIHVAGSGGHTLVNMVAEANSSQGFLVASNDNTVERSVADYNGANGFLVLSLGGASGNSLVDNVAEYNSADGFNLGGTKGKYNSNISIRNEMAGFRLVGEDNGMTRNTAAGNESHGFYVLGSDNRLYENVATDGEDSGFVIASTDSVKNKLTRNIALAQWSQGFSIADGATMSDNLAVHNEHEGMSVAGANAKVTGNVLVGNFQDGLEVFGANSTVSGNRSLGNDELGIEIGASPGIAITGNSAIGNDLLDLLDNAVSCAGHTWSKNVFDTGVPFCTD